jgi:hypothetical protein
MTITLRPVGHMTQLITRLTKWRDRRVELGLTVSDLNITIAYLIEFRELTYTVKEARRGNLSPYQALFEDVVPK